MFYYLFEYLETHLNFPGASVFQFISFRAGMAIITSLLITMVFGKGIIRFLRKKQVGEIVRDLGLEGQNEKEGTPTMGGLIILAATLLPTLLFSKVDNIYVVLMLVTTVWLGFIGFLDDYIKVFKKEKKGLAGKFKVLGQVGLGVIIGATVYFHPDIKTMVEIPEEVVGSVEKTKTVTTVIDNEGHTHYMLDRKRPNTTIPFVKGNEFNYSSVMALLGQGFRKYTWVLYILVIIFIITAVSNGANLTDGLDGLASGTSSIMVFGLGILIYLSGNILFANYLKIMYIPNIGELTIFVASFLGACVGFLWYNAYPAQVFMGDTGSLAIGGIIAALAIIVRKELLIPILCGVFLVENLSVVLQVGYFKYTKRKYGQGKRIFKMAPLHHHYQLKGMNESKIVTRFWIASVILAVLTIITLKVR